MYTPQDLAPLKELHALLGDSRKGYRFAATKMELPELAELLTDRGRDRSVLQEDLAVIIRDLTMEPVAAKEGSMTGTLHRIWVDLRERFSCWDDAAVLDECERGDRYLLERYDVILQDGRTPQQALTRIRRQRLQIESELATLERTNDSLLARI